MKTIYKYTLRIDDRQQIPVPARRKPLCVQMQNGNPCLWVEVDDEDGPELLTIVTRGTGHPLPDNLGPYIGTYQIQGLVFHVYQEGE